MSKSRISKIFGPDSKSLWNVSVAPGWTKQEAEVLRCAIMKYGIGCWKRLVTLKILPGKTVSQIVCQVQRMIGQQSLKEFLKLHADVYVIGRENAKRTGVCRKNGIIVNDGHNLTTEEVRQKREINRRKYGLTQEEIDRVVIPVLTEKQTSEVFDKRTSQQLERQHLLSRLAILRSALQVLRSGSDSSSCGKRRRINRRRRKTFNDISDESDDNAFAFDVENTTPRRSRRQRGLDPDFVDPEFDIHDYFSVCLEHDLSLLLVL